MNIKIGNNNKIKNTTIAENIEGAKDKGWVNRHPLLTAIITAVIGAVIMMFSFWKEIIEAIESFF